MFTLGQFGQVQHLPNTMALFDYFMSLVVLTSFFDASFQLISLWNMSVSCKKKNDEFHKSAKGEKIVIHQLAEGEGVWNLSIGRGAKRSRNLSIPCRKKKKSLIDCRKNILKLVYPWQGGGNIKSWEKHHEFHQYVVRWNFKICQSAMKNNAKFNNHSREKITKLVSQLKKRKM